MMSEYNFKTEFDILRLGMLNFIKRKEFITLYNLFLIGLWGIALDKVHPNHSSSIFNFYKNFMKDSLYEAKLPGTDMVETINDFYNKLKTDFNNSLEDCASQFVLKYSSHQQSIPTQITSLNLHFGWMYEFHLDFCNRFEVVQEKSIIPCPKCSQKLRVPSNKKIKVTCIKCGHVFIGRFY